MKIAFTMSPGRGDTDLLLSRLADRLAARGLRLCGTIQINTVQINSVQISAGQAGSGDTAAGPCDMDVKVLPEGPVVRISQALGKASRGCRLDPRALEAAVALTEARLDGADVLIVNKFGKHEAEGRGFRGVIAEALARGIPVLVGVNALNETAFATFSGGLAEPLPPDLEALCAWILEAREGVAAIAG